MFLYSFGESNVDYGSFLLFANPNAPPQCYIPFVEDDKNPKFYSMHPHLFIVAVNVNGMPLSK